VAVSVRGMQQAKGMEQSGRCPLCAWSGLFVNKAAQALGRMGKGKAKTLTQAERKRRGKRLAEARKRRWPHTSNGVNLPRSEAE